MARLTTRRRFGLCAGATAVLAALPTPIRGEADGVRLLRARPAKAPLAGSDVPSIDRTVPGPVLRARRGEEVKVRLVNELAQETSIHWHGVRLANAMDGVPHLTQAPVAPGASFDYRFVPPDAGTFWYHPLLDGGARPPRGPYGALIVEEPEPAEVDRELVLLLDSWSGGEAKPGIVNGQSALDIPVRPNERLRLRLINAARADAMALVFEQHRPIVMAIDGEPAEPFAARDGRVVLGPGNRVDVFVGLDRPPGTTAPLTLITARHDGPIGRFVYAGEPVRTSPLPDPKPLPANPLPLRIELRNAHRVSLAIAPGAPPWIEATSALAGAFAAPLFSVKRGRVVVLAVANQADAGCALHLHGHHVRLLDNLDDGWKPFWLDTVMIAARQTARVAFVADNPGNWLIEERPLESGAAAVTWFAVT